MRFRSVRFQADQPWCPGLTRPTVVSGFSRTSNVVLPGFWSTIRQSGLKFTLMSVAPVRCGGTGASLRHPDPAVTIDFSIWSAYGATDAWPA
jgi:hypothetical protein